MVLLGTISSVILSEKERKKELEVTLEEILQYIYFYNCINHYRVQVVN